MIWLTQHKRQANWTWFTVLLLAFINSTLAERLIKTSALLTCQDDSELQARQFNVVFYPDNGTALVTASVTSSINTCFVADLEVIAYGITITTLSVKSADLSSTLCPMSPGYFDVDTSFQLGTSVTKMIPGIAYVMPDLDGIVRVKVYTIGSDGTNKGNSSIACVEAQLSNGKTVQTKYASWGLFAVLLIGLLVAGVVTLLGHVSTASHITSNIVSLFAYFQSVALICMMAVQRLPPIAAAWGQNFMWTMGIISFDSMQNIMKWYVRSTGGTPTNIIPNAGSLSIAVYRKAKRAIDSTPLVTKVINSVMYSGTRLLKRYIDDNTDYATTNERDSNLFSKTLILHGINRVAYKANIEISSFFLTGATFFIFVGLIFVFALLLVRGFVELLTLAGAIKSDSYSNYRTHWQAYTKGFTYRYFLVGFTQLSVLCLWELTQRESVATVVTAIVLYLLVLICLGWASIKVIKLARESIKLFHNPAFILYGNADVLNRWGFLYVQFKASAYWFLVPLIGYNFVKSAVIALGQANGKVQAVMVFVFELIFLVLISWLKPYMDKKTNAFNIAIAAVNFINALFFLFYSQLFGSKADVAASIVGVVFFIMNAVVSLVLLILIIVACVWAVLHKNPDTRYEPMRDDRDAFIENYDKNQTTELTDMADVVGAAGHQIYGNNDSSSRLNASNDLGAPVKRYRSDSDFDRTDSDYPSYRQYRESSYNGASQSYHSQEDRSTVASSKNHYDSYERSRW